MTPPVRRRIRGRIDGPTEGLGLRAVLGAAHLLGLATGAHLRKVRSLNEPTTERQAALELAELRARLAWKLLELVVSRFARLPEKRRPYFSTAERFRVLEIKKPPRVERGKGR